MMRAMRSYHSLALLAVIAYLNLLCHSSFADTDPYSNTTEDLVKLSQTWWGTPIDRFAEVAGLNYGDYSQGDYPSRPGHKVIVPSAKKIQNRWAPKELTPLAFIFTDEKGLVEISGFYKGKQAEVVAALTEYYGKHSREARALGMVSYQWDFDKTFLEITRVSFSMYPNKSSSK